MYLGKLQGYTTFSIWYPFLYPVDGPVAPRRIPGFVCPLRPQAAGPIQGEVWSVGNWKLLKFIPRVTMNDVPRMGWSNHDRCRLYEYHPLLWGFFGIYLWALCRRNLRFCFAKEKPCCCSAARIYEDIIMPFARHIIDITFFHWSLLLLVLFS